MDQKAKKALTESAVIRKILAADVVQLSLVATLIMPFIHASFAAYNLSGRAPCESSGFPLCYKLRAADVGGAGALLRVLLRCSASQAAPAAMALLLTGRRALAFLALALISAYLWSHASLIEIIRVNGPGDLFLLALQLATVFFIASLEREGVIALSTRSRSRTGVARCNVPLLRDWVRLHLAALYDLKTILTDQY